MICLICCFRIEGYRYRKEGIELSYRGESRSLLNTLNGGDTYAIRDSSSREKGWGGCCNA